MVSETAAAGIGEFVQIEIRAARARCWTVRLRILDDLMYLRRVDRKWRSVLALLDSNIVSLAIG